MPSHKAELAGVALVAAIAIGATVKSGRGFEQDRLRAEAVAAGIRQELFAEAQPAKITNCEFVRIGEINDGGYLACGNLLAGTESAYSYGISGYDGWGCQISRTLHVPVHEYDCFDLTKPSCPGGQPVFHPECVGTKSIFEDGRPFDSIASQIQRNGDAGKTLVMKMDVEGAEWDAFLAAPDETFDHIAQLVVEFHHVDDEKYVRAFRRLKTHFLVAHVHYNNASCRRDLAPFPAWAFEVLLVNKRVAQTDGTPGALSPTALDARNDPGAVDCQSVQ